MFPICERCPVTAGPGGTAGNERASEGVVVSPSTNPKHSFTRRASCGSPPSTNIFVFGRVIGMLLSVRTALPALAESASLRTTANVRNFYAERCGYIDLVVLLLYKDLANLFRQSEFTKRFALPDAIAVITYGGVFIFEIEP